MRTATTPQLAAQQHPTRRRRTRHGVGSIAAVLVLVGTCALILSATVHAASPTLYPLPVVVATPQPGPPQFQTLPLVAPTPAAPATPTAPGQVKGIQAPSPGILPPVAVLPAPPQASAASASLLPLALLAVFAAMLLVATVLTARRRV